MSIFRKFAPLLLTLFLVLDIFLLGILFSQRKPEEKILLPSNVKLTVTPVKQADSVSPIPEKAQLAITSLGKRIPGTIENIDLFAEPITKTDSVAMIKLLVENGEVLNFTSAGFIALGSCQGNVKFTSERVCVDIAKTSAFVKGEKLGTVQVKWRENGKIYREAGDGYFNGAETSLNVPKGMIISDSGIENKPSVAGLVTVQDRSSTLIGYVLIFIGAALALVAGIGIYINTKQTDTKINLISGNKINRNLKILVSLGILLLAGGTIFAANIIATTQQTTQEVSAYKVSPVYITVMVSPSYKPTDNVLVSAMPSITTLTPMVSPTVTPSTNPLWFMPTPITDNVPLVCGALDVNGDKMLNYIDLQGMLVVYNHQCSDHYQHFGCGGKDTNEDGWVDYRDSYYLLTHYYPITLDCTRY